VRSGAAALPLLSILPVGRIGEEEEERERERER